MARSRSMRRMRNRSRRKRCHSRGKRGGGLFGNLFDSPEMKEFKRILNSNDTISETLKNFPDNEQKIDNINKDTIESISGSVKDFYVNLQETPEKLDQFRKDIEEAKKARFYKKVINTAVPGAFPLASSGVVPAAAAAEEPGAAVAPAAPRAFGGLFDRPPDSQPPSLTSTPPNVRKEGGVILTGEGPGAFATREENKRKIGFRSGGNSMRRRHRRRRTNKIRKSRKGRKMQRN